MLLVTTVFTLAQPQTPAQIEPDTPQVVTLDGSGAAVVTYASDGSETVQVIARALAADAAADESMPPLDTVLEVVSPSGERLAYNDDYFPISLDGDIVPQLQPTDSAITALTLKDAGTYEIRVNSFNGVSSGEVELVLEGVEPVVIEIQTLDEADAFIASVTLRPNQVARIDVELETGRSYIITARDPLGVLDAVLEISDADGTVQAANDDGGFIAGDAPRLNIFDSRIAGFTPTASGDYSLVVRDYLGRGGTFEVEVRPAE